MQFDALHLCFLLSWLEVLSRLLFGEEPLGVANTTLDGPD